MWQILLYAHNKYKMKGAKTINNIDEPLKNKLMTFFTLTLRRLEKNFIRISSPTIGRRNIAVLLTKIETLKYNVVMYLFFFLKDSLMARKVRKE